MRRNSRRVRLSPYLIPKLETISDTAKPAPWRRACMRTNQLPMPASGARIARFGRLTPPSSQGSLITLHRLDGGGGTHGGDGGRGFCALRQGRLRSPTRG